MGRLFTGRKGTTFETTPTNRNDTTRSSGSKSRRYSSLPRIETLLELKSKDRRSSWSYLKATKFGGSKTIKKRRRCPLIMLLEAPFEPEKRLGIYVLRDQNQS